MTVRHTDKKMFRTRTGEGYHKEPRELSYADLYVISLPKSFWGATRDYIPEDLEQSDIVNKFCADVVEGMSSLPNMYVFSGEPNSGKTSCAGIMAKAALAHKYSVFFADCSTMLSSLRSDFLLDDEHTFREKMYKVDLLILDQLGAGYSSNAFVASETMGIITHRQNDLKKTIITTTASDESLQRLYGDSIVGLLNRNGDNISCTSDVDGWYEY